jgi:hypothetical protein
MDKSCKYVRSFPLLHLYELQPIQSLGSEAVRVGILDHIHHDNPIRVERGSHSEPNLQRSQQVLEELLLWRQSHDDHQFHLLLQGHGVAPFHARDGGVEECLL